MYIYNIKIHIQIQICKYILYMHVSICLYVCMYVCMHACMYVCSLLCLSFQVRQPMLDSVPHLLLLYLLKVTSLLRIDLKRKTCSLENDSSPTWKNPIANDATHQLVFVPTHNSSASSHSSFACCVLCSECYSVYTQFSDTHIYRYIYICI